MTPKNPTNKLFLVSDAGRGLFVEAVEIQPGQDVRSVAWVADGGQIIEAPDAETAKLAYRHVNRSVLITNVPSGAEMRIAGEIIETGIVFFPDLEALIAYQGA